MLKRENLEHEPVQNPRFYDTIARIAGSALRAYGFYHEGAEVLNDITTACVITPTHYSNLDSLAVAAAVREATDGEQIHFLAKNSLFKPIVGKQIFRRGGGIPANRKDLRLAPADKMHLSEIIGSDALVGCFAQSTRQNKPGNIGRPVNVKKLKGAHMLSYEYGIPALPAGIAGTLKGDRGPITVVFGKPIFPPLKTQRTSSHGAADMSALRQEIGIAMQSTQEEAEELRRIIKQTTRR